MKKASDIKPIPKRVLAKIREIDFAEHPDQKGPNRFYSYLTSIKGDLIKITVVARTFYGKWHCKQVAARGVKSKMVWVKDMAFYRIAGYIVGWNPEGYTRHSYSFADGKWYGDDYKAGITWNPWSKTINLEYANKFKEYRYSAHQLFKGDCIIEYLKLYLKYPQTEYLIKLGLLYLHDKTTILQKIAKDRKFCKWLVAHRNEIITGGQVYAGAVMQAYRIGRPIKQVQKLEEFKKKFNNNSDIPMLQDLFGKSLEHFFEYVTKKDTDPYSYIDYIKACQYLHLDLNRRENLMPNNFQRMHDRRIEEQSAIKARADEEKRKELYQQFAGIVNKYLPLQNCKRSAFAVFIAKSPAELIREGEQLVHCVGKSGYENKMVREETLIFFVRATESPNTPLVTIEYSLKNKKVLQAYGKQNTRPDESVMSFINGTWLPYANRTLRKIAQAA